MTTETKNRNIKVGTLIAEGGNAKVYNVEVDGKALAVKIPSKTEKIERVERTISLYVKHPNIATCEFILLNEKNRECMFMEKADTDLLELLIAEKPDVNDAIRIALDVAEGMMFLHSRNVIHRDLKAENVLIFSNNGKRVCKIADFGQALLDVKEGELLEYRPVGTTGYQPPELKAKLPYTRAIDVYTYGLLLIQTLSVVVKPGQLLVSLYGIALTCCERNPAKRTTFPKIVEKLNKLTKHCVDRMDLVHEGKEEKTASVELNVDAASATETLSLILRKLCNKIFNS
jgi:serine/threonine protein kinase